MTIIQTETLSILRTENPDQPTLPGFSPVCQALPTLLEGYFNRLLGTGFVDGLINSSMLAIWQIMFGKSDEMIDVPNPQNLEQPFSEPAENVVKVLQLEQFVTMLVDESLGLITEPPKIEWRDVEVSRGVRAELHGHLQEVFGSPQAADVLMAAASEAIQRTYTGDVYEDIALPDGVHHAGYTSIPAWYIFKNWNLEVLWAQVVDDNQDNTFRQ